MTPQLLLAGTWLFEPLLSLVCQATVFLAFHTLTMSKQVG